jgi:hypothetical protein
VVNAPTRPPNRSPYGGRPPRGPRPVANRPTSKDLRNKELLLKAAADLRERGKDDMAGAIDHVLSPSGWPMLGRLLSAEGSSTANENMSIYMSEVFAKHVKDAVQEDQDDDVATVTDAVNKGLRLFLAGQFTPDRRAATRRSTGEAKTVLNVRPDNELRAAAQDRLRTPELVELLGAEIAVPALVRDYLMRTYPLPEDGARRPVSLPKGAQRNPEVPREVREQIRAVLAGREETVEDIVNEGLGKFLGGEFDPIPARWSSQERESLVVFRMHPDNDLWARATARVKGTGMRASHVAVAYLLDELGIEAGTAD